MRDLRRKLLSLGNHFFERLKTANFSTACGTSTLKSLPSRAFFVSDVHLRPRKHFSRCTLDCGFKTPESPALRGFVTGPWALATAALYLVLKSNGLHRPKIRLKKFGFSSKSVPANIAKKLPSQRCSQPLYIAFFNFSHKWPTFVFAGESGHTLGSRRKIAHSGSYAETGAFPPPATASSPKEQPEEADARLWRVSASSGVAAPLGCVIFFCFCQNCGLHTMCSVLSACARRGVVSLPSARFTCC